MGGRPAPPGTRYDGFAENRVGDRLEAWHGRRYGRENTQTWTDDKLCLMPSCTELRCLWLVSTCRVHAYMHAVSPYGYDKFDTELEFGGRDDDSSRQRKRGREEGDRIAIQRCALW